MSPSLQSPDGALPSELLDASLPHSSTSTQPTVTPNATSATDLALRHRLRFVEDQWEAVLRQECGQDLIDLLSQLRNLSSPEGQAETVEQGLLEVVEQLDLDSAIRSARAFALYFQLINIVEQHYEQQQHRDAYEQAEAQIPQAMSPC